MSPKLTRKIVQHLLSERAILEQVMNEYPINEVNQMELAVAECEQLLIDIEKEMDWNYGPKKYEPTTPPQGGGGDGQ